MFEYFTDKAIAVVMLAQEEARRMSHASVGTEQILLGLLREQSSPAAQILTSLGVHLDEARQVILEIVGQGVGPVPTDIPFTPKTRQVLEQALQEARQLNHRSVTPEHLLLSLTRVEDGVALHVMRRLNLSPDQIRDRLQGLLKENVPATAGNRGNRDEDRNKRRDRRKSSVLEEFGTNLTEEARQGRIDPVVGRDTEIERVVQILGRRTKNNPILLGEPGVGKTAIAEGIAQRIVNQNVPEGLQDVQVISLNMGTLVAGTRYRGDFEERLTQVLDEVRAAGNIVLVIDEIHTLVGAGALGGGMDAANLLKPALARGELQCIGATTLDEYRKYIERDAALERRFQPVQVGEPSVPEAIEILQGLRSIYEQHHRVVITDEALKAAAELADRYISDRFLPDKAIDLLDEAGSRVRLRFSQGKADKALKQQLRQTVLEKQDALKVQDFAKVATLYDREQDLDIQIQSQMRAAEPGNDSNTIPKLQTPVVDVEAIAQVVAAWTGIPVMKMTESESALLLHLEDMLHERVIGQDEAVEAIGRAMRRSRLNLGNPTRPIASFFFSGPTGVGKTELSKALAAALFGSEDNLIRLDMSEYMEPQSTSKLIGSPPGFVGYDEGGGFTELVRRKPYSVILFDEVEKAHPDIFNLLLQVLDDGRLTDAKGRVIDFKNTVIIMTSNLGARAIEKGGASLGFALNDGDISYQRMRDRVTDELKNFFRPEFLNRIDEVIVFRQLNQAEVTEIADLMVAEISQRLADKQITLTVSPAFKALAVEQGFDVRYGARPLRRALQQLLEDPLAEAILEGRLQAGDTALIDVDDESKVFVETQKALAIVG
jgi:ATP-dependent Clp protease ATP-binding subunit ClpC